MKKILEWTYLWVLLLVFVGVSGCSDDDKVGALAEPVPLKMTLNRTDLVMGETLEITFDVTGTVEGDVYKRQFLSCYLSANRLLWFSV